ncbi:MAG: helicase [Deltaproteobacteria bacterium]|nr:helicase [Deltaproteobacteria bacterium]
MKKLERRFAPTAAELKKMNAELRAGTLTLDWTEVCEVDADIAALFAGVPLDDEALGLGTMRDEVAEVVAAQTAKKKPAKKNKKTAKRAPKADEIEVVDVVEDSREALDAAEYPPPPANPPPPRVLAAPPSRQLRAELHTLVAGELVGPAGGPEEEIDEQRVSERYILGALAPRYQRMHAADDDDLAVEDGGGYGEEGREERPPTNSLLPSSIGMTFAVDRAASAFVVDTAWGRYERVRSARAGGDGKHPMVWKRCPMLGKSVQVPLAEGPIARFSPVESHADIYVDGVARKTADAWVVSLFLVNGQQEPDRNRDEAWLFQPELRVSGDGPIFVCRRSANDDGAELEQQAMAMLYRHRPEFAVGHGVATCVEAHEVDPERATEIATVVMPSSVVPDMGSVLVSDAPALSGVVLDMKRLAEAPSPATVQAMLAPLLGAYRAWIDDERAAPRDELGGHEEPATAALARCEDALTGMRRGLELLAENVDAFEAFRFLNRAMWQQRVHALFARAKKAGKGTTLEDHDQEKDRTWRPFQMGFILLNLPGLTLLDHPDRSEDPASPAHLLWFPTGGGKTEAYLGLAAYTFLIRRLQGTVSGYSGASGVAVLMRYTLRLLTLQQFQRAAALVCACEVIRREQVAADPRYGQEPFRLGLWVGERSTPLWTDHSDQALRDAGAQWTAAISSPKQLTACPWCGSAVTYRVSKYPAGSARTLAFCAERYGRCAFTEAQAPKEGLPVVVVDEEIYRRLPSLVIATVDKLAQMPWKGQVEMLFGRVTGRCPRHGFVSSEVEDAQSHVSNSQEPNVRLEAHPPLRPPDLIIQDELHLISGPLGSLTGLYETAVDALCTWEANGRRVRPKVIASTATIRRARDQVHALFGRKVAIFPPHGTSAKSNFFSLERTDDFHPGRLYLGVCASGRRMKAILIRVYAAFLAAGQVLLDRWGEAADPWMTAIGYFNAMRELAGMRRLIEDDVRARLRRMDRHGLARRMIRSPEELTSRRSSDDIPKILDRLELKFSPQVQRQPNQPLPLDVVLATNMISVGVDVPRLGLMLVCGQPKTTSEYIQATSRVGRGVPGIVCTVYNWTRPRDLSHFERFEHYHQSLYRHVEPLSLTPFASRALDRGLTGILVALTRLCDETLNPNSGAEHFDPRSPVVAEAIDAIVRRAETVTGSRAVADETRALLQRRIDMWAAERRRNVGARLGYREDSDGPTRALLRSASERPWTEFACLNSLRDVEPSVPLVLQDAALDDDRPWSEE